MKPMSCRAGAVTASLGLVALAACGGSSSKSSSATTASGSAGSSGTTAVASSNLPAGPITIGFAIGQSGFMQPYDVPPSNAAQMAVDDVNAKGGVLGHQLKLISEDTKSDRTLGATAAEDLISKGAQVIVVSCDFDFGSPAAIAAAAKGVVAMSTCAASPQFDAPTLGPLVYSLAIATPAQGSAIAHYAYDQHYRNAYVLLDPSLQYDKTLCTGFEDAWKKLSGTAIVGSDTFQQTDTSISGQIAKLSGVQPKPDFAMFCSYPPGGATALRQIRAAGVDLPILAGESFDGSYWQTAVPNLSNMYVMTYASVVGNDPRTSINDFMARYSKQFGGPPATSHALTGYAVVQVLAAGLERAKTTKGADLAKAIDAQPIDTVFGSSTFTAEHHISYDRQEVLIQIQNDAHTVVAIYSPDGKVG